MNISTKIEKTLKLQEKRNILNDELAELHSVFVNRLKNIYKISHSILRKINFDYSKQDRLFVNGFEFLLHYHYTMKITVEKITEHDVKFEYAWASKSLYFTVPLKIFHMSDRDYATLFRQHIKEYKSSVQHKEIKDIQTNLSSNTKQIKKLQNENKVLERRLQKLLKIQQQRANNIENNLIQRIKEKENKKND